MVKNYTGESHPQNIIDRVSNNRVVHLNDASLLNYLLARPDVPQYLLDVPGCRMDGALSDTTRHALQIQTVTPADLRPGDNLAMILGPLANDCMAGEFYTLVTKSKPVNVLEKKYWTEGVWQYGN